MDTSPHTAPIAIRKTRDHDKTRDFTSENKISKDRAAVFFTVRTLKKFLLR